jgi:hypothetical protein
MNFLFTAIDKDAIFVGTCLSPKSSLNIKVKTFDFLIERGNHVLLYTLTKSSSSSSDILRA